MSLVAAFVVTFTQAGPALAADNVFDRRCTVTTTSLGEICVFAWFDNTNCTANTVSNCSGLNGATLQTLRVSTSSGSMATQALQMGLDIYGDGSNEYVSGWYVNFYSIGTRYWEYVPGSAMNDVNRVCLRVRSAAADLEAGVNVGGLNPYGLSQAGSCGM